MLIGFRPDRAVFLFAFAENEPENIGDAELMTLREIAGSFLNASTEKIAKVLNDGALIEVQYGDEGKKHEG
jgi:hypothetical protein